MKERREWILLLLIVVSIGFLVSGCSKEREKSEEKPSPSPEHELDGKITEDKGYELPISDTQRQEADEQCREKMTIISEEYLSAEKGDTLNVSIDTRTRMKMLDKIKKEGVPVIVSNVIANMENYQQVESFLTMVKKGEEAKITIYEIHSDGGIGLKEFSYDGTHMYLLYTCGVWGEDNKTITTSFSYNRVDNWRYTEKGWFIYEVCVPEYPEVTEEMNGYGMLRVKPRSEEEIRICNKYLMPIGYQGNNLFVTEWDKEHMEEINYNQLFPYFYEITYQKQFEEKAYEEGIVKEEFERMMEEFLPITKTQIEKYATFDQTKNCYEWKRLGCLNYTPTAFATSIPEIVGRKENGDGTITYTIDAVCELLGTDRAFSHELTIRELENGKIKFIKNHISFDGS